MTSHRLRRPFHAKYVALSLYTFACVLIPGWLLLVNSFKTDAEADQLGLGLPTVWRVVENYSTVIQDGHVLRGFVNTLLVVLPTILIVALLSSMAAWIFARSRSWTVRGIYYVAISGVLVPPAIVTTIFLEKAAGIYGGLPGLGAFYTSVSMAFAIFLITGFVKSVPLELEEAARVDGASTFIVYLRIVLPLLRPVLVTISIVSFIGLWSDFFWPLFLLRSSSDYTIQIGLYSFVSSFAFETKWSLLFANVVVVSVPLLLVFFVGQRQIIGGLLQGARR
jgi:ABC-type sugar transport system, permease component